MPLGISLKNLDPQSTLKLQREEILLPIAADVDYVVNEADISAAAAGDALTLLTPAASGTPLAYPRRLTVTSVDASGSNLSVSVKIVGKRFGAQISETITATGAGGGETVEGTLVFDEVNSATISAIANAAASDTVAVGVSGKVIGLRHRIKSVKSVKKLFKIANGTPDASGCIAPATLQASTIVEVSNSAINVFAAYGSTLIAVTDRYIVEYVADGEDFALPKGWRA